MEIAAIEKKLADDSKGQSGSCYTASLIKLSPPLAAGDESNGVDSLDAYMADVGSHMDRGRRTEFKLRLHTLKNVCITPGAAYIHTWLENCSLVCL